MMLTVIVAEMFNHHLIFGSSFVNVKTFYGFHFRRKIYRSASDSYNLSRCENNLHVI
jgi:hypothetical protein